MALEVGWRGYFHWDVAETHILLQDKIIEDGALETLLSWLAKLSIGTITYARFRDMPIDVGLFYRRPSEGAITGIAWAVKYRLGWLTTIPAPNPLYEPYCADGSGSQALKEFVELINTYGCTRTGEPVHVTSISMIAKVRHWNKRLRKALFSSNSAWDPQGGIT